MAIIGDWQGHGREVASSNPVAPILSLLQGERLAEHLLPLVLFRSV